MCSERFRRCACRQSRQCGRQSAAADAARPEWSSEASPAKAKADEARRRRECDRAVDLGRTPAGRALGLCRRVPAQRPFEHTADQGLRVTSCAEMSARRDPLKEEQEVSPLDVRRGHARQRLKNTAKNAGDNRGGPQSAGDAAGEIESTSAPSVSDRASASRAAASWAIRSTPWRAFLVRSLTRVRISSREAPGSP